MSLVHENTAVVGNLLLPKRMGAALSLAAYQLWKEAREGKCVGRRRGCWVCRCAAQVPQMRRDSFLNLQLAKITTEADELGPCSATEGLWA
jgi:hypothetical protein